MTFNFRRWTWTTFWGWLIGVILIILLSAALDAIGIEHMQFYIGTGMGASIGLVQWLLLRKAGISGSWVWLSVLGMSLPLLLFDYLANDLAYRLPICVALGSVLTGSLQYLLLRKQFSAAFLWVTFSFLGWTLAALSMLLIEYTMSIKTTGTMNLVFALINLIIILSGGLILGSITAYGLKKIFNTTPQS